MKEIKGERLYVALGASKVRRRLKGHGFGVRNTVVELRYKAMSKVNDTATFACPLIVSIPKGGYKAIQFVENGRNRSSTG
jgi:hypothetical protein